MLFLFLSGGDVGAAFIAPRTHACFARVEIHPVFHVIPHITPVRAYELPHRREIVSGAVFRISPLPDFGNSSIVMTALRRNWGYLTLVR